MKSEDLFKENEVIPGLPLKNRFCRSSAVMNHANPDGTPSEKSMAYFGDLAKNDVGLIITEAVYVSADGPGAFMQLGLYNDRVVPKHKEMTDALHKEGAKIVPQLAGWGVCGKSEGSRTIPLGPSKLENPYIEATNDAMTLEEIKESIKHFIAAGLRAMRAGYDGIELHGAHGYLLHEFASPFFNKRTDEYGGSLENRAKFASEIIKGIREQTKDFPIIMKVSCEDFAEGGHKLEDTVAFLKIMKECGLTAVEVSGGSMFGTKTPVLSGKEGKVEGFWMEQAKVIKKEIGLPVILIGGFATLEKSLEIINEESCDLVSFCRPLIREVGLIKRWKDGDLKKVKCVRCNKCFGYIMGGTEEVKCYIDDQKKKREKAKEEKKKETKQEAKE